MQLGEDFLGRHHPDSRHVQTAQHTAQREPSPLADAHAEPRPEYLPFRCAPCARAQAPLSQLSSAEQPMEQQAASGVPPLPAQAATPLP